MNVPIRVIDIFAGPGGLSEGFAAAVDCDGNSPFRISLSIEKDPVAHETLELRSFIRQFETGRIPNDYYKFLRGEISRSQLFEAFPSEAECAKNEAWLAELGVNNPMTDEVDRRIEKALVGAKEWVLLGGPPCQAYSVAGRSRNKGKKDYRPETDNRHYLYQEYLRIIAKHSPAVFIMENVKGLLSSKVDGDLIFNKILSDLKTPIEVVNSVETNQPLMRHPARYHLYTLTESGSLSGIKNPRDFIVQCEHFGIPQARHRIIVLGVREDISGRIAVQTLKQETSVTAREALMGLPPLRSGISDGKDSFDAWKTALKSSMNRRWLKTARTNAGEGVYKTILKAAQKNNNFQMGRGAEYVECKAEVGFKKEWYLDRKIKGVCNHRSRKHMLKDLHRYLFASGFAQVHGKSPTLRDFPKDLLPKHKNVNLALNGGYFTDRFRVQVADRPSTTITSHISKDGHYYIHPDVQQCRSMTVREAARLQTFPDNYFFRGGRTAQYSQVGNAVPPLLAKKIAEEVVLNIFDQF